MPKKEPRSARVIVLLTPQERAKIESAAKDAGLSLSDHVRHVLFAKAEPVSLEQRVAALERELADLKRCTKDLGG
jgi:uncharacterized protein (DUF1778 family)